jgi:NSS family neurotransmitter:Na+ symporter
MGTVGNVLGAIFFVTVFVAALTSCISLMEALCSGLVDKGMSRGKATAIESGFVLVISTVVCLGYNLLYFDFRLPNGDTGQILDILDYLANNMLMPVLAILTCVLIGWIVKPKIIVDEATKNGERFLRRGLYVAMVKYIAPAMLIVLLLVSFGVIKT